MKDTTALLVVANIFLVVVTGYLAKATRNYAKSTEHLARLTLGQNSLRLMEFRPKFIEGWMEDYEEQVWKPLIENPEYMNFLKKSAEPSGKSVESIIDKRHDEFLLGRRKEVAKRFDELVSFVCPRQPVKLEKGLRAMYTRVCNLLRWVYEGKKPGNVRLRKVIEAICIGDRVEEIPEGESL